jgi:DNA-binding IclR family transcriptional regulator
MNTSKENTSNYSVPNLERGLSILELLAEHRTGLTIQEIKNTLDLSQTTVFRITQSLQQQGYLARDEESRQFYLTRKMLTVGFRVINEHDLLELALPWMRRLRDQVKETVFLGVMGDGEGIFIEQALGSHPFKFMLTPGNTFPYHCSAPGKAMLAHLPEKEQKETVADLKLVKYNGNTITSKKQLERELSEVRAKGYAMDREEQLKGVVCIGAPVMDYMGLPKASIWVSGPLDRLQQDAWASTGELVRQFADKISFEMGFRQ